MYSLVECSFSRHKGRGAGGRPRPKRGAHAHARTKVPLVPLLRSGAESTCTPDERGQGPPPPPTLHIKHYIIIKRCV